MIVVLLAVYSLKWRVVEDIEGTFSAYCGFSDPSDQCIVALVILQINALSWLPFRHRIGHFLVSFTYSSVIFSYSPNLYLVKWQKGK